MTGAAVADQGKIAGFGSVAIVISHRRRRYGDVGQNAHPIGRGRPPAVVEGVGAVQGLGTVIADGVVARLGGGGEEKREEAPFPLHPRHGNLLTGNRRAVAKAKDELVDTSGTDAVKDLVI